MEKEVLKRYEAWEAKLILTDVAWKDGLPQLTHELFEELLEIQELRNKALNPQNDSKRAQKNYCLCVNRCGLCPYVS